jgi:hypothetical protein
VDDLRSFNDLVAVLTLCVAFARAAWLFLLVVIDYRFGVAYIAPLAWTAYRPVPWEWLAWFPKVLIEGLDAYGIQTLTLSWETLAALPGRALVCTAMLVMHHYRNAPSDATANPPKRTAVRVVAPLQYRRYATLLASTAAGLRAVFAVFETPVLVMGVVFAVAAAIVHARTDLAGLASITHGELR